MPKYQKKPVVIEAVMWTGMNITEMCLFTNNEVFIDDGKLEIDTLEGTMKASIGDYIIKGVRGEFYPCKPEIFKETYERID